MFPTRIEVTVPGGSDASLLFVLNTKHELCLVSA
jgi:hypothetical protein